MKVCFKYDTTTGIVTWLNTQPQTLDSATLEEAILKDIDALPSAPQQLRGKDALLCYNAQLEVFEYRYIDRALTVEEEVEQLKTDNETLKLMVAELGLMVGGVL